MVTSSKSLFLKHPSNVLRSNILGHKKGPAEAVLPSPAEEVQPATGAVDTVRICHHWIHPLHVNNCLVQLSYQIWPQKTTEGSPDCWANHWYNPPHSPGNVLIPSEQKGWQTHSGPLTSSTPPLWNVTVWSTLQSSEHQNDQTQKQFLNPSNPFSWKPDIKRGTHNTIIQLFIHHILIFFISNLYMSDLTHNCLCCILFFCCLSCPVTVLLLHCEASVTITNSSYV